MDTSEIYQDALRLACNQFGVTELKKEQKEGVLHILSGALSEEKRDLDDCAGEVCSLLPLPDMLAEGDRLQDFILFCRTLHSR